MIWPRKLALTLALFFVGFTVCGAETVAGLPAPTGYVNDFAGVLNPTTKQNLEALCTDVDKQAHAQIAVVTIKTIDGDQSIDEFATALEEKWKVGAKGTDRGLLMLFVMTPRAGRIEVGYGLEGILNDAKVGTIGRTMVPAASQNDYNTAIPLGVQQIAQVIAADAGVTLTTAQPIHRYHREGVQQQTVHLSFFQVLIVGGVLLFILFLLIKTGNVGLIFFLLGNILGGGGGGGGGRGRDDDRGGGGFGGFGGGSSGGGGASGDW
ncbi:TPM domain-containing protein [Granulicella sibirica]|uniref:Beta-propeller domains of methanol dehydrogenase type n=1 Tax=Granulicella sibirica TaxID=2479048 RepID=A0A4Q0T131_9BACT|nr:TPM domain-containing protein [Granulicella sibirica]RXH56857.1 Beta-propeller domains of methanol dehydrogenase type [Granulicella sibirica]